MDDVQATEPEVRARTVNDTLADMDGEVNGLVHATPSGVESAVIRLRAHLREVRGFVDPNGPQAKAMEAERVAAQAKEAEAVKAEAAKVRQNDAAKQQALAQQAAAFRADSQQKA